METRLGNGICAIALLATLGFTGTAGAQPSVCTDTFQFPLKFTDNEYTTCFTDVRRGPDINDNNAPDLGGTGHTALNFTGGAGPAGDIWLTKFTPDGATRICDARATGGIALSADVLIHTYNNTKGAGLVALLDSAPGGKALAFILYNLGNSDSLQLAAIDPATGQLTKVKSVSLRAGIAENAWYLVRVFIRSEGDVLSVVADVNAHQVPTDPSSPISFRVGEILQFIGSLSALGLEESGEVGIAASAFSTNVNSSVTNFSIVRCFPPPSDH